MREKIIYQIWYKAKGTTPLMPAAIQANTKRECDKWIKKISENKDIEIVTVTQHKRGYA